MNSLIALLLMILLMGVACISATNDEPATQPGHRDERVPVLVELFTSEGCSSCPPADELLAELIARQPVNDALIVPLAFHVDYWNNLGWKDRFSAPEFTQRQRDYATAMKLRSIYTPQMVVDGQRELIGSDRGAALQAITHASHQPKSPLSMTVTVSGDSVNLDVRLGKVPPEAKEAEIWVALTEDDLHSSIVRGENAGRKLTHSAVVRRLEKLGPMRGEMISGKLSLDRSWSRDRLHVVAFVQERASRRVIGVSMAQLP